MVILLKKGSMPKHDIIVIILKFYVSKMYLIVLLPNLKRMYDQIDRMDK